MAGPNGVFQPPKAPTIVELGMERQGRFNALLLDIHEDDTSTVPLWAV